MKRLILILTILGFVHVQSYAQNWWLTINADSSQGTFQDTRDGKLYKWVKIENQTWMAENLNYGNNKYSCYLSKEENCNIYGKLYPWKKIKNICPNGWHLPNDVEWTMLIDGLGGEYLAGGKMKEAGILHWSAPNAGATNSSGFSALPGGYRTETGYCENINSTAIFWTSSEDDRLYKWVRMITTGEGAVQRLTYYNGYSFSVRCIKDE